MNNLNPIYETLDLPNGGKISHKNARRLDKDSITGRKALNMLCHGSVAEVNSRIARDAPIRRITQGDAAKVHIKNGKKAKHGIGLENIPEDARRNLTNPKELHRAKKYIWKFEH